MKLTFTVDGREALPVRAIPWVAGYGKPTGKVNFPPSLLMQVVHEASHVEDLYGTPLLRLYRVGENGAQPVSIEYLNATAPESDFQPETDEPLRESTHRLPAGVFVFMDELRRCVDWLYPPGCFDGMCQDVIALNANPDLPAELFAVLLEGFLTPKPNENVEALVVSEVHNPRKAIFWLAPNEILIPADQIPGAIADTLYPRLERSELAGQAPNDPNAIKRLEAEREQAQQLRIKFPYLKDGDKFSIGDLNDYLSRLGMVAEIRHRSDVIDNLDPECRWTNRLFVDGFKSVQDSVPEAKHSRAEASDERCIELANLRELYVDHWIELVGVGLGQHGLYDISAECVKFRKHEDEYISLCPAAWQADMMRDNRVAPRLDFPCAPIEMLNFVDALAGFCDSAIGMHSFMLPDGFRLAVAHNAQIERCNELATLPELRVHHWEELTGIGICEGGSYAVNQDGVFPEKYSNRDLQRLTQVERHILLEHSYRPPLKFPCTPSQLLAFVDGDVSREFEVPDDFRTAVELRALLVQKDNKQGVVSETPKSDSPQENQAISGVDRNDTTGMVSWQADIIENQAEILRQYGNAVSARNLMLWCKTKGSTDVFKRDQPKNRDSMQWTDSFGANHTVTLGTIGSQLSVWRKNGIFPPRN